MEMPKKEKLFKRLENHLRSTARHLVKFDTEEETLQYLIDSFRSELKCDFVGIILKEGEYLTSKVWSGELLSLTEKLPLKIENCTPALLNTSLTYNEFVKKADCEFIKLIKKEKVSTWFTVPLKDDIHTFGFCIIGFFSYIHLLEEMDRVFIEFGKDVAVALSLAKNKEAQKKKMMGVEWISQNLLLNDSIENIVERLVERAGRGTNAKIACIYLYNETENCFVFQPPSYGEITQAKKIVIDENYVLKEYFPNLETIGGNQLSVPLVIDLKTIGVLHVEDKGRGVFTEEDLEILELLSNHVAAVLENARLYNDEKEHKQRLHYLLEYQQALVKETVEQDNFDGITENLSKLFGKSVILFDRFMRPIAHKLYLLEEEELPALIELATYEIFHKKNKNVWFSYENENHRQMAVWPVNGGGDLLGYLAVDITNEEIDDYYRLSIDLARNIYSIQFIKQKLVLDAKEQVKDSFIHKLLVEKIENEDSIIQYANLFNWDLFHPHRVAVFSIILSEETSEENILEQQAKKTFIWEQLKTRFTIYDKEIIIAHKEDEYILIVPARKEEDKPKVYWARLYEEIKKWLAAEEEKSKILIGIGGKADKINDYYMCYQQGVQALNVVYHRYNDVGFALFEELGSYTLLHHLKDSQVANLFINKHLSPLLQYSEGKSMDLFQTLRIFLYYNGSIKDTSEELYIHRSSLLYRLEKIESLLDVDLNYSEHRFNLMMAYKLYDLYYSNN